MSNNDPTFEGIPIEIREMIYEFAFTPNAKPKASKAIDILTYPREVSNSALRYTNKLIYDESRRAYRKALVPLIAERKQVLADLTKEWETMLSKRNDVNPDRTHDYTTTHQLDTLIKNLKAPKHTCKNHTCARENCWMCSNPSHKACFDCGRNAATALYTHFHLSQAPELVIEHSDGKPSSHPLAKLLDSLPEDHTRRFVTHPFTGVKLRITSWAFTFWQREFQRQRGRDVRCCIRARAVSNVFQLFGEVPLLPYDPHTMALVASFEQSDPMMKVYEKATKLFGKGIPWSAEYERRVRVWFREGGGPDFTQKGASSRLLAEIGAF
ncbi:hypothetical protein PRZ48_001827 [Zasmidium cellare]|uniref:Uncharacterized protein n=1 Tax=Zasmidium cellare TaxID=395010 RepID=A0ABR0F2B3_ZASCE|nr:hypothetical protein PRZ48_001827 [Zasmidium cellare]